jgi:hypothetical protein
VLLLLPAIALAATSTCPGYTCSSSAHKVTAGSCASMDPASFIVYIDYNTCPSGYNCPAMDVGTTGTTSTSCTPNVAPATNYALANERCSSVTDCYTSANAKPTCTSGKCVGFQVDGAVCSVS